jgi:hypothetical protein
MQHFRKERGKARDARLVTLRFVESDDSALQIDLRASIDDTTVYYLPINSIARLGNFLVARASVQD